MTRRLDALVHERVMKCELDIDGEAWAYGEEFSPSSSIEHAWQAESKMGEDGALMELYTDALIDIVSNDTASIYNSAIECEGWGDFDGHTVAYKLAHATAKQRCIAMCLAVGVGEDEINAAMKREVGV